MIGSATPSRGSMCTSSRTMQPSGSSSRVRSCDQTRCHQLDDDSRKPRPSGNATSSTRWRSTGMNPSASCQSTGALTRQGSESKGAPPVGWVIRTKGATSRLTPPTVDTAAHTSERLARNLNSKVSRIAQVLPPVAANLRPPTVCTVLGVVCGRPCRPSGPGGVRGPVGVSRAVLPASGPCLLSRQTISGREDAGPSRDD